MPERWGQAPTFRNAYFSQFYRFPQLCAIVEKIGFMLILSISTDRVFIHYIGRFLTVSGMAWTGQTSDCLGMWLSMGESECACLSDRRWRRFARGTPFK